MWSLEKMLLRLTMEVSWPLFRRPKVRLKTKLAGSREPEIVTFDRQSGIIKQYFLSTSGIIATSQRIWPCCLLWFAYYEKKRFWVLFFILQSKFELRMSGSVSFTVKHFAPKMLTKYFVLVSFEPKLNVRFYLAVASGTIKNSKKK